MHRRNFLKGLSATVATGMTATVAACPRLQFKGVDLIQVESHYIDSFKPLTVMNSGFRQMDGIKMIYFEGTVLHDFDDIGKGKFITKEKTIPVLITSFTRIEDRIKGCAAILWNPIS